MQQTAKHRAAGDRIGGLAAISQPGVGLTDSAIKDGTDQGNPT